MWYTASLLYKSTHTPTEPKPTIWEEQILLISARSEAEARDKAEQIGNSSAQTYKVKDGLVVWKFERIERIYSIEEEELVSGTEVFSRFLRDSEVTSLLTPFD